MKIEFSWQIFEKYLNIKVHENPSSGSRVVRGMDRQTDMMKLIIMFGNFANTPKNNAIFVKICLMNFYEVRCRNSLQKVVKCDFLENRLCLSCAEQDRWSAFCLHFPHFMTDLHEFSVGYLHVMKLSSCVCCENRSNENHTLLMSLLWIKFCAGDIHKSVLSDWVCADPCCESLALLRV
jgi:hypothetical protein